MRECPLCELELEVEGIYPSGYAIPKSDQKIVEHKNARLRRLHGPSYRMVGFSSISGRTPHSPNKIVAAIDDSISHFFETMGWAPTNLFVVLNPRLTRAMGRSIYSSRPSSEKVIDINPRLLLEYDIESFRRVMLHELSHHMRFHQGQRPITPESSHDAIFCDILAKVDPKSAERGRKSCVYFNDDVDTSVLKNRFVDADSVLFNVVVSRGKYRVRLISANDRGHVPWDSFRVSTIESIARMYPGKLSRIRVISDGTVRSENLLFFLNDFVRMNPTFTSSKRIAEIIQAERRVFQREMLGGGQQDESTTSRPKAQDRSRPRKASTKKPVSKKPVSKKPVSKKPVSKRSAPKKTQRKSPPKKRKASRSKSRR